MNYQIAMIQIPLLRECLTKRISTPKQMSDECDDIRPLAQEAVLVFSMNGKHGMINRHLITIGLVESSQIHPREIFRPAILDGATAVIIAHNHPSGDPTPSGEDIRATKQIVEAGKIIGIYVSDHLVIGGAARPTPDTRRYVSMKEQGLMDFN